MSSDCAAALERFNLQLSFDRYNIFNCHTLKGLVDVEDELAVCFYCAGEFDESEIRHLRSMIGLDLAAKLLAFSLRMASNALQKRDDRYLVAGASALVLDDDINDPRDVYLALTVLADAGARILSPIDGILVAVSRFSTPKRTNIIVDGFLRGPEYMRSIKSMGVELENDHDGSRYKVHLF